ncbi:ABC transporter ATP-binding protein, partial [Pseudomonas sp. SIMBA_021]
VFYAIMVAMSVATVAEVYGELQRAAGAAARLLELLAVKSEIENPENPQDAQLQNNASLPAISLENISFNYPSRPDVSALNKISLSISQ